MSSDDEQQHQGSVETFAELGLDNRLIKALVKQSIEKPTLIQSSAIPFAMQGKDILAKAKTGSGKTLAYLLPILHRLLTEPTLSAGGGVATLILVPSRDLAKQVMDSLRAVMIYCPPEMRAVNLANEDSIQLQRSALSTSAGSAVIAVSTPSRVLPHLGALGKTKMIVIDEADLILGFGYGPDMDQIVAALPHNPHALLMSASLTPDLDHLRLLLLHNAVVLKLEDPVDEQANLKQFTIECATAEDKFLLIYVILKLGLLKGKILCFVNDVDRSYRLKLFLEQFGIKSCVVNAELPLASRHHIVEQFNKGVYDLLIASDQAISTKSSGAKNTGTKNKKNKTATNTAAEDNGMARGIDFKRVDVVLNFDFPTRLDSYIHRVGRTARAGQQGTAISLVTSDDQAILGLVSTDVLERTGLALSPYAFDMSKIEGFRYRCQDAIRSVTGAAVKEARLKDLKKELVSSERLKTFFAERPADLELLKHDKSLLPAGHLKPHLKHVPAYLVKKRIVGADDAAEEEKLQAIPQTDLAESNRHRKLKSQPPKRQQNQRKRTSSTRKDPLKSIKKRKH